MAHYEKYQLPVGQFARNITEASLINKDSSLYHENSGYSSGWISFVKPFSQALYGHYNIVERLDPSPLNIDYQLVWEWDALQMKAYADIALIFSCGYLKATHGSNRSFALSRVLDNIQHSCDKLYMLNGNSTSYFSSDIYQKLQTTVTFINDFIKLLEKCDPLPKISTRLQEKQWGDDINSQIARLMYEIISKSAAVKEPYDTCWSIQHNTIWAQFFSWHDQSQARKIILFKLRRLMYEEITGRSFDFGSARILGVCLNVLGFELQDRSKKHGSYALHKLVLRWTQKHFLALYADNPVVAKACIMGTISFDEVNQQLVKTYGSILGREPDKRYLTLLPFDQQNHDSNGGVAERSKAADCKSALV